MINRKGERHYLMMNGARGAWFADYDQATKVLFDNMKFAPKMHWAIETVPGPPDDYVPEARRDGGGR